MGVEAEEVEAPLLPALPTTKRTGLSSLHLCLPSFLNQILSHLLLKNLI